MLNMEATTKLPPDQAATRLRTYFGAGGLGLGLIEDKADRLTFQGGGGYVTADLRPEGGGTKVGLVTQEYEYQVEQFFRKLP